MRSRRLALITSALLLVGVVTPTMHATAVTLATAPPVEVDYSGVIAALQQDIPATMQAAGVVGLTIALVDGPRVVWTQGFGSADRLARASGELWSWHAARSLQRRGDVRPVGMGAHPDGRGRLRLRRNWGRLSFRLCASWVPTLLQGALHAVPHGKGWGESAASGSESCRSNGRSQPMMRVSRSADPGARASFRLSAIDQRLPNICRIVVYIDAADQTHRANVTLRRV